MITICADQKGKQAKLPMEQKRITEEAIQAFRQYLIRDEKSAVTVEKYLRDIRAFQAFIGAPPEARTVGAGRIEKSPT